MKVCLKCGQEKSLIEFTKDQSRSDGLSDYCKVCRRIYSKVYYVKYKKEIKMRHAKYYIKNSEKIKVRVKRQALGYPEKINVRVKQWALAHPEEVKARVKRWVKAHPVRIKEIRRKYRLANSEKIKDKNRRIYDTPRGKLNSNIKGGILRSLRQGTKAGRHWEDLVGFTVIQLKRHLEKLFTPEMNWNNYGTVWEIDHKIPIAVFNFEKPEHIDFGLCWSLKNLQPMEAKKNMSKGARLDKPFQPSLSLEA